MKPLKYLRRRYLMFKVLAMLCGGLMMVQVLRSRLCPSVSLVFTQQVSTPAVCGHPSRLAGDAAKFMRGQFRPLNCSDFDFLTGPDPSAEFYNRSLVCGPCAQTKDIFCRIFFIQTGLQEGDACDRQTDDTTVPLYVYYVIFGDYDFHFWNYISVVAAKRFIAPTALYVIGNAHPRGYWWQRVLRDVHGLRFVYRPQPTSIGGVQQPHVMHASDVVRLQALLLNGGIYLDADMVVTRPLNPLLSYDITLGLIENGTGMGNAFVSSVRNSAFIRDWYQQYNMYNKSNIYWNSLQVPRDMWHRQPHRVHMESARLYRPNWFEAKLLFKGWDFNWTDNYAVHVWTNSNPVPKSEADIQSANTTIAQIFRHVLYGDPRPRVTPKLAKSSKNVTS